MAPKSGKKLTLYLDSTTARLCASIQLLIDNNNNNTNHGLALQNSPAFTQSNIQITYIPILLGAVMQQAGNTPPLNITNKKDWIELERTRTAKALDIPMPSSVPNPFPQPTTNAQRVLCYIYATKSQPQLIKAHNALYAAFWQEGVSPINDSKNLAAASGQAGGFSGEEVQQILEGAKSDEAKKVLRANSDAAFKDGCFGLPYFVATNKAGDEQKFWGVDHVGHVLDHLGVEVKGEHGRYKSML